MIRGCDFKNIFKITRLNTFFQRKLHNGYVFKGEYHDFYEVVCVLSGEILVTAEKEVYTLKSGEITFHPPGEFHALSVETETDTNVIIFSFEADRFPYTNGKIFSLNEHNLEELDGIYKMLFKVFNFEYPEKNGRRIWVSSIKSGEEYTASIFIKKLELFLIGAFENAADESEHIKKTKISMSFYKILTVLEENLSNNLTVEEIAELCGISVPTLEKTVHRFLGYGAVNHYNILKMQKAYGMLMGGASVKETAFNLGFLNQNYFSARFKKHYGISPSKVK